MAGGSDESNANVLPSDDILMEVLSWLPAKSLMRFKSISKHWFSVITHPHFAEMHRTRSYAREGGVILVEPPRYYGTQPHGWDRRFFMIDWTKKDPMNRASIHEPSLPYTTNRITNIVDGLICFYDIQDPEVPIIVYNFTTRESLPLPLSVAPTSDDTNTCIERICHLGFDPINKVYKVFHIWWPEENTDDQQCQVITLGHNDNRWRLISTPPGVIGRLWDDSFCEDGFLYWISYHKKVIVTLNVELELFDFIDFPQEPMHFTSSIYITQLGGHLTLVKLHRNYYKRSKPAYGMINLWRRDRKDNHCPVWSKEVLPFPFVIYEWVPVHCSSFGLVPLVRYSRIPNQVIIECYMLATGKHKKLKVNNAQGVLRPGWIFCPSKLVENIIPLKNIGGSNMLAI